MSGILVETVPIFFFFQLARLDIYFYLFLNFKLKLREYLDVNLLIIIIHMYLPHYPIIFLVEIRLTYRFQVKNSWKFYSEWPNKHLSLELCSDISSLFYLWKLYSYNLYFWTYIDTQHFYKYCWNLKSSI